MRNRLFSFLMMLCLPGFFLVTGGFAQEVQETDSSIQLPHFNIGIVTDGPGALKPDLVALFKSEVLQMAEGEFLLDFPVSMLLEADGTNVGVNRHLDTLLANPETDLILALGTVSSTEGLKRRNLEKTIVAPFVFDAALQEAPREGNGSGVKNLFYLNLGTPFDEELIEFRKLIPFKSLGVLLDERDVAGVPAVKKITTSLGYEHSINVSLISVGSSALEAVSRIPESVKTVIVGPLWQFGADEVAILSQELIKRKIAGFATINFNYVEDGLFATTMPENSFEQIARQVAISIQEILLGEDAATLPTDFFKGQKLTINMETARAINIYPSLDYMTGAHLLNEQREDIERRVNLPEVVAEALTANLDLAVAEQGVEVGMYVVGEAKSTLLPQLFIGAGGRAIDDDRAALSQGTTPESAVTGSLSFSQQIYSENSWAGYTVEKYRQTGREYDRDSVKLDIMYDTSTAYLDVLRRGTVEQLQKDNMKLTQANLERAQIRLSTGVAGPDELYRWQTQFANDRQIVLRAESASRDAMQALNRILNRPLKEEFIALETDFSDPLLIGGERLFYELIHNPLYFDKFNDFAMLEGLEASPELKVIDASIAAQERLIVKSKRDYWVPTFSVDGDLEYLFTDSGEGQRNEELTGLDDTDWQVGIFATIPLVEGGRKRATLGKDKILLLQLQTKRRAVEDRISQRILQSLNNTRASYPAINLSRDAVDAARRNLQLVTDSYVQGIKSIIDLLDAQNQALNAELDAANAVYNFLIDLMGVQRSIGTFITFLPLEESEEWTTRVQQYLRAEQ
jgi:outer membrane protein